ncbi:MAG: murein L,D-transpeptidase [Opitutaceae bacterium]|nr:murein L,D-transpeptidase [Opitutaceae bacterium]
MSRLLCSLVALSVPWALLAQETTAEHPPVTTDLELQVELHRRGFSCGAIDGIAGPQTAAAVRAWQRRHELPESGRLDAATRALLRLGAPALKRHIVVASDLEGLQSVPTTWLGKSQLTGLAHATALERIAEWHRASPRLLQRINPGVDWDALAPGAELALPDVAPPPFAGRAAEIVVRLAAHELEAFDAEGRILMHCPVSIARKVEKRPSGELRVIVVVRDPNYTFDPELFPDNPESREIGRKLIIPPGPNNPVGLAWIGLSLPGYGIHGTPDPEKIGRTESLGCFRLANWDAVALLDLVRVALVVRVEP